MDTVSLELDNLKILNIVHQVTQKSLLELLNPIGKHLSGLEEWSRENIFEAIDE